LPEKSQKRRLERKILIFIADYALCSLLINTDRKYLLYLINKK